ncbi:uncharacterized protein QC761_0022460 [Podospora bellae-mahoneyi]|uniref:Uncharacterized protein n=1 Tax=Podospora bellae-mahoneyi TaxID=2093777 RepID=A0ABR0G1F2_9PEZI|nr:hypothetical protein QC761_0022460 [Podospora bellae-mahoneyi]
MHVSTSPSLELGFDQDSGEQKFTCSECVGFAGWETRGLQRFVVRFNSENTRQWPHHDVRSDGLPGPVSRIWMTIKARPGHQGAAGIKYNVHSGARRTQQRGLASDDGRPRLGPFLPTDLRQIFLRCSTAATRNLELAHRAARADQEYAFPITVSVLEVPLHSDELSRAVDTPPNWGLPTPTEPLGAGGLAEMMEGVTGVNQSSRKMNPDMPCSIRYLAAFMARPGVAVIANRRKQLHCVTGHGCFAWP